VSLPAEAEALRKAAKAEAARSGVIRADLSVEREAVTQQRDVSRQDMEAQLRAYQERAIAVLRNAPSIAGADGPVAVLDSICQQLAVVERQALGKDRRSSDGSDIERVFSDDADWTTSSPKAEEHHQLAEPSPVVDEDFPHAVGA